MELQQLHYFLAVTKELNFRKAAQKLNISQPPLSRHISELEKELEVQLFTRNSSGVEITEAGRFLEKEASRILENIEYIKSKIGKLESGSTRLVRIGFIPSAMHSLIPGLVELTMRTFPNMLFLFDEIVNDDQARALREGRIDLGIGWSGIMSEGIRFIPMLNETLSIIYSRELDVQDPHPELYSFRELPYIVFSRASSHLADYTIQLCEQSGFTPKIVFDSKQFDTVFQLVSAGLGWSIVPTIALLHTCHKLNSVIIGEIPDQMKLGIALREGENDAMIHAVYEIVKDYFNKQQAIASGALETYSDSSVANL